MTAAGPRAEHDERQPLLSTRSTSEAVNGHTVSETAKADESDPQKLSDATRYTALAAVWVGVFLGALDTTIVASLVTDISASFGQSNQSSWLGTAYLTSTACITPLYGRLADIIGRRYASLTSLALFTLGTFGCGASPSLKWLIVSRCIAGMGGGANLFYGLGAGLGGPVGGLISDNISWRAAFLVQVPILILALGLVYWKVRYVVPGQGKSKVEMAKRIDYLGSLTLIGALVTLLLAMSYKNNDSLPWSDARIWALSAASIGFWLAFIGVQGFWASEPVMPLQLFQERNGIWVSVSCFCTSFVTFSGLYFLPMHYEIVRKMSSSMAGAHLVPNSVALSAGSLFAGWMIRKTGSYYWLLVITSALPVISMSILTTLNEDSAEWLEWVSIIPAGFGFASVLTCTLIALISAVDRSAMATATGLSYLMRYVGQVIGVASSSSLLQAVLSARLHERIKDGEFSIIPPELYPARTSYHDALRAVFILNTCMATLCFISTWFLKEYALPGSFAEEERQRQERLNNSGSYGVTSSTNNSSGTSTPLRRPAAEEGP
ncbi:hypothetical protein OIO90_002276 [Microbotryomycetes sp. JL221]|nr:hypothetical protein OIO90_002276 [Microbotryomycetes sp. JL221]